MCSGAIAHFYWARGDTSKMPTFPVLAALKNTVVYHLGSIAIGSFIIAIIQLIRYCLLQSACHMISCFGGMLVELISWYQVLHLQLINCHSHVFALACRFLLEYFDKKTKQLQEQNKCAQWAMCCVKCCMWCLEKIVAFINRNAYIMIAIKGTNYCVSAGRAIALIVQVSWLL